MPPGGSGARAIGGLAGAVKRLRAFPPVNATVTATVRALGIRSPRITRHLPRVGTVRARLPNGARLVLWSRGDDYIPSRLYWDGWDGYEPETARVFFDLAHRASVTLDIGAYVGYYALLAAHANPAGRVLAFEPFPPSFQRLVRNVELNGRPVECIDRAAGDEDGEADLFYTSPGLPMISSLDRGVVPQPAAAHVRARTVRLDEFLLSRGVRRVDLVKIDVESAEPRVLAGMAGTVRRDRPAVVCEINPSFGVAARTEAFFFDLAYRAYLLTADGPAPRARVVADARYWNYLFLGRDEAAERLGGFRG